MNITQGGVRLRDWLREERRTQEWLGEQIGTHQTNVSRWIRGHMPPLEMALAIRDITGIEVDAWRPRPTAASVAVVEDASLHARAS